MMDSIDKRRSNSNVIVTIIVVIVVIVVITVIVVIVVNVVKVVIVVIVVIIVIVVIVVILVIVVIVVIVVIAVIVVIVNEMVLVTSSTSNKVTSNGISNIICGSATNGRNEVMVATLHRYSQRKQE